MEGDYDTVILLECDGIPRTRLDGLENRFLINIDHHTSGRAFADVNWIDSSACAVAELVYQLAGAAGIDITRGDGHLPLYRGAFRHRFLLLRGYRRAHL